MWVLVSHFRSDFPSKRLIMRTGIGKWKVVVRYSLFIIPKVMTVCQRVNAEKRGWTPMHGHLKNSIGRLLSVRFVAKDENWKKGFKKEKFNKYPLFFVFLMMMMIFLYCNKRLLFWIYFYIWASTFNPCGSLSSTDEFYTKTDKEKLQKVKVRTTH